ncbi:MAG: RNA-binding protein [Alphaproteobacteria bacterium]|nr:MAG: RNA-binding protein [Alphaproteobacteria bacterium]
MTRGGRSRQRAEPERRCIVTGRSGPVSGLVRFVIDPEGRVVFDPAGRLPGRGIWVSADRAAIETAVAKRLFARAARRPVVVPEDLADRVETGLVRRVIDAISLARKAGQAVAGLEKTKDWLASGRAAVLVQARDGSAREKARLRPPGGELAGESAGETLGGSGRVEILDAAELGLAFGRERVIHCALAAGGLSKRVVEEAARLAGLRKAIGASGVGKDTKVT